MNKTQSPAPQKRDTLENCDVNRRVLGRALKREVEEVS